MLGKSASFIEAKARALGLSSDELTELAFDVVERSADGEAGELRALIDQVNRTIPETLKIVDARHRRVKDVLDGAGLSPVSNKIDVHIGGRIRLRREMLGLAETKLAESLGVRREQIRQFERGTRRVGAARLIELSRVLDVPVAYFFDDLAPLSTADPKELELAHNFALIPSETDQEAVIEFAHSLAAE